MHLEDFRLLKDGTNTPVIDALSEDLDELRVRVLYAEETLGILELRPRVDSYTLSIIAKGDRVLAKSEVTGDPLVILGMAAMWLYAERGMRQLHQDFHHAFWT